MKKIYKIFALIFVLSALITLMAACKEEPTYSDYTVTVVDGLGSPLDDVIVKFVDENNESKTRVTDKDGSAVLKNTLDGNYKVFVEQGFSDAIITQNEYALSESNKSIKIIARNGSKTVNIYGNVADDTFAYNLGVGNYNVVAEAGKTSYFVFYANTNGVYKVSFSSSDSNMTVGYYGIPMFVQSTHCGDGEYDGNSFELIIQDTATPYVIGLNCMNSCEAELVIERTGDAPFDPDYAPWTQIEKEAEIEKCVIDPGVTLVDFDVSDPTLSVSLGDDGFYYTADGKLVYIRITSNGVKYLETASLAYLAGFVSDQVGMNIGGYIYDENGEFVEKRNYNLMIEDYMEFCDSTYGVVPLTEELAECVKLHGESTGWWNPTAGNYLFGTDPIVHNNAWLFLCMLEA
nr:carboxypeptidase regulatory-like domain-containing protein [Oscillospiraceae bacterium]